MAEATETGHEHDAELAWWRKLAEEHAWIVHLPSRVVGRVKQFYDRDGQPYVSPLNHQAVHSPVVELESGHSFVCDADAFLRLSDADAAFYQRAEVELAQFALELAHQARAAGVTKQMLPVVLTAALRNQADVFARAASPRDSMPPRSSQHAPNDEPPA